MLGCTNDADASPCAISIKHNSLGTSSHYDGYNAWKIGDTKLDWYGAQRGQVSLEGFGFPERRICVTSVFPQIEMTLPQYFPK